MMTVLVVWIRTSGMVWTESLLNVNIPDVQDIAPEMWNLDQVNIPEVWSSGYTGSGVVVSVIDTGVDATHPEFAGRMVPGRDFISGGNGMKTLMEHMLLVLLQQQIISSDWCSTRRTDYASSCS